MPRKTEMKRPDGLTESQLEFIRVFAAMTMLNLGVPPSTRDLAKRFGWEAQSASADKLTRLTILGYFIWRGGSAHAYVLSDAGWRAAGYEPPVPPKRLRDSTT